MIISTQGLVLHTTKYGESSLIAKIFTRELGLCSYIVKGVRSAAGRNKQNLLQPLSHLDMSVYNNPKRNLQYIKEMHPAAHYNNIVNDGVKMALLFFMDEVLYKSLKDEERNSALFDYVVSKLSQLDNATQHSTMPIDFLINTARHLGFEPMDNYSSGEPLFNLKEGRFQSMPSLYNSTADSNIDYFLDPTASSQFHSCLSSSKAHQPMPYLTASQRNTTLSNLLEYYHVQLDDFQNFKSHQVLHSVLK